MQIKGSGISKDFIRKKNGSNVLNAVMCCDIRLDSGELTLLKGRSGGGKSTLLNMLSGVLAPSSGNVYYDDVDIYALEDSELSRYRSDNIGYVPQGKSAISSLNVMDNIMLPGILYGKRDEDRALELMERFNIEGLKEAKMDELSGGELRRMAIARALFNRPKVLFADEPTGDLDDENTRIVFDVLREIADDKVAVLLVTHEYDVEIGRAHV